LRTLKLTVAPAVGNEFTDLSRGLVVAPPGNDLGSWKVKDCDDKTDCDEKKRKKGITMKILGKKRHQDAWPFRKLRSIIFS